MVTRERPKWLARFAAQDLSRGIQLLRDPHLNKSTAFTEVERERLELLGLLPEGVEPRKTNFGASSSQLAQKTTDLERYIYLTSLQDNDETLYYKTLMSDPAHFMPLVYTPRWVRPACSSATSCAASGMYLSINRRGRIKEILAIGRRKESASRS